MRRATRSRSRTPFPRRLGAAGASASWRRRGKGSIRLRAASSGSTARTPSHRLADLLPAEAHAERFAPAGHGEPEQRTDDAGPGGRRRLGTPRLPSRRRRIARRSNSSAERGDLREQFTGPSDGEEEHLAVRERHQRLDAARRQ
ncbi:hypothetical protein LUX73_31485 [Actinomadura madurae]|nr:hypothetical protein [Actinomadura madurae]MCQ0008778.1 hypothetical protein [Actinomadura madurae]